MAKNTADGYCDDCAKLGALNANCINPDHSGYDPTPGYEEHLARQEQAEEDRLDQIERDQELARLQDTGEECSRCCRINCACGI